MRVHALRRLSSAAALVAAISLPNARAEIKITAVPSTVQLQDGQSSGFVRLLFKVEGLAVDR